ncbi:MAG: EAL domain-containing protein [Chloroflexota bacterium]|nr:EAL domain-containing protein [Chloroflexota bacterium]
MISAPLPFLHGRPETSERKKPAACERCEAVPAALPDRGALYISPPLDHTQTTLRNSLRKAGIAYSEPYSAIVQVELGEGVLQRLSTELGAALSAAEMRDSKSLILDDGVTPTLFDLMRMQPLSVLLGRVHGEWLLEMMHDERLVSHFQPIVACSDPQTIFAYECLLRGREEDGTLVYPDRLFGAALTADLLFQLDRNARITAVRSAAHHNVQTNIFINFNPSSIYDPVYCLRTTLEAVRACGMSPEQIVFEVVESSEVRDVDHLLNIMSFYRSRGFKIALDDLGAGYSSLNLLTRLKPDFVKLDLQMIRDVDSDPYKAHIAAQILEMARKLGVRTIAEGVETEAEWLWTRDTGADYVQGYYFARPASPPPAVRRAS